jgi:glycosyltransferase involved in cell wall biosynthesis
MQSQQPFVSILTPVYNTEKYLGECIESVLAQTYTNWEYLIVNNCSTDGTLAVAQSFADKDPRIRVHNNTEFLDVYGNHNRAMRLMSRESKYCKVVSADDWIFPDCIRQMVNLAEANPTVGIVTAYQISSERINNLGIAYPETVISGKEICRRSLLGGPYVLGAPTSHLYRSDLIRSVETFYPEWGPHADTAACYEYLDRWDFGFVHQILTFERVHVGQTSEASRVHNYYVAEHLLYLEHYGAKYLTQKELKERIHEHLDNYYGFLARSVLTKNREFWIYHKHQLKAAGCPLNRARLLKSLVGRLLDKLLNPKQTIEGLLART